MEAIARLLQTPLPAPTDGGLDGFVRELAALEDTEAASAPAAVRTMAHAVLGGARADRLGFAFVAGYRAALACLGEAAALTRPLAPRVCFAVTEAGGVHPRAIVTSLGPAEAGMRRLDGEKTFVTLASASDELLVAASEGRGDDGRPRLRVVRVGARVAGVTIRERPPTPFAPEVPHARVRFEGVVVPADDVLAGDGYARYVKPFRTLEDEHVLAAALGYLVTVARAHALPAPLAEGCVMLLHALAACAGGPSDAAHVHLGLAGAFAGARQLVLTHEAELAAVPGGVGERLARDLPLLDVAATARARRTAAAWSALSREP